MPRPTTTPVAPPLTEDERQTLLRNVASDVLDLMECNCVSPCDGTCTYAMARRALARVPRYQHTYELTFTVATDHVSTSVTPDEWLAALKASVAHFEQHPEFLNAHILGNPSNTADTAIPGPHTCPEHTEGSDLRGCGHRFYAHPNVDGTVDCPACDIWFKVRS